ncbi:hypothetical protein [Pseudomonas jilinensis]|nr:hypothetical protein [Pseudomonas jilinensis]
MLAKDIMKSKAHGQHEPATDSGQQRQRTGRDHHHERHFGAILEMADGEA